MKKRLLLPVLGLVIVGVALAGFYQWRYSEPSEKVPVDDTSINLNPPTEEDREDVQRNKEELSEEQTNQPPQDNPSDGSTAKVVITYAGQYESGIESAARVSNVYEEGGTCTFTFEKNGSKVTKQSRGIKDVRDTICPAVTIPRAQFPESGLWVLSVKYTSSSSDGVSDKRQVEVK